jgi:phospholipid/cholesterol/gamma-HCH transport system ATP-binding protein
LGRWPRQGKDDCVDSTAPLFRLENLGMRFDRQAVLAGLNLEVPAGQTLVIIGGSGCGKTVLLKLLVGLLQPTAGRVWFDGKALDSLGQKDLMKLRLQIGFLFQGAALFDSLNVYDNVAFGPRILGLPEAEVDQRVQERLRQVNLQPELVRDKMPADLSGGMKKRVGLARALALNPRVMLYDEPTTGLDPITIDVINRLIVRAREVQPMTSIVVTHEIRTVEAVADRVIMLYPLAQLKPGEPQIIFDGTLDELKACADQRVRDFIHGDASRTLNDMLG